MASLAERMAYRERIMKALYEAREGNRLLGVTGAVLFSSIPGSVKRILLRPALMVARQPWPTDGPDYPVYGVESRHPLHPAPGVPPMGTAS